MRRAWLLSCAVGIAPAAWADPVTYAQAIQRASGASPTVEAQKAALDSARQSVRPAGQLPDPHLALDIENVPVSGPERFRLNRDEMTMASIGIMQDMPSDATRRAREGVAQAEVRVSEASIAIARLEARLAAANAWIDLYFAQAKLAALKALEGDATNLDRALVAAVGAGGSSSDKALAAKLAVARLQDRIASAQAEAGMARAELERWIGPLGSDGVGPSIPQFDVDPAALRVHVEHHVELAVSEADVGRAKAALEMARAARDPDWSWSLMYGRRDPDFGDMVSFGLKFSLPLFQSDRQTPMIDARQASVRQAGFVRDAVLREHLAMLEAKLAEHASLQQRLARLRDVVAPLAAKREEIALAGQAAGTGSLETVFAMRLEAREVDLDRLELERQLLRASAYLTLEYGEGAQ
jgi:cobalt-zinc-cadmium efflux system outer membrane protein